MASSSGAGRNGSSGEEQQGIHPRYRRAFGCATWFYMAILTFLAAAFLLLLPFRYVGDGGLFKLLGGLSFFGFLLILPGTALAAMLGARTYRSQSRRGKRTGAGIGAIVGWTGFFAVAWLTSVVPPPPGSNAALPDPAGSVSSVVRYSFVPLALVAAGLVLYALFARSTDYDIRRNLTVAGAAITAVAGLALLATDLGPSEVTGALVSTAAGALGGWVAGYGYSRAGGDAMTPPGATIKPREPRSKPR